MSFRIEQKLLVNYSQIFNFKKWLNEKGYKKLYDDRIVNSLYFENISNSMFHDSEEGVVPRKKIRVRNYPQSKIEEYFLENKISSLEGRFKKKKSITKKELKKIEKIGYSDNFYSSCHPKFYITYIREYYNCKTSRLTIDTNIIYRDYKNKNLKKKDTSIAVEIKTNPNHSLDELLQQFPFQRIRFSKYSRGFILLYT
tara:strand:- start:122 stop:715 length:594 start_codon:yes stop_codon:yes gene_type:complete